MGTNVKRESSTSSGDPNPCPICLGPMVQDSYLDKCYHKFCYDCIVQWTKVVASKHSSLVSSVKCPLCKTENFSIIYGYDGTHFLRHYINQNSGDRFLFSKAHKYRLQCYYTESGILNGIFNVSRYWKSHKYLQSNQWLQGWLRREIQALMQEEDVEIVVHHIVGVVGSFLRRNEQMRRVEKPEAKQEEFKALVSDAARPFLMARVDRFVNEMELFLASGLNIEAFDAVYMQRLGWNSPRVTIESPERGSSGQTSVIVPHLHIFDVDYDGTDRMFLAISEVCFDFVYELTGIIEAVNSLSCEKYYDLFEDPNFSFLSLNWIYIFKFGKCIK